MGEECFSSGSTNEEAPIKINNSIEKDKIECNLVFHGAAASSSCHSVMYLKETDALVYASHGIVNLATTKQTSTTSSNNTGSTINSSSSSSSTRKSAPPMMRNVHQTLRTDICTSGITTSGNDGTATNNHVITCLTEVQDYRSTSSSVNDKFATTNDIACGFSNGRFNLWWWFKDTNTYEEEEILGSITPTSTTTAMFPTTFSVTDMAAMKYIPIRTSTSTSTLLLVVTASCTGITLYARYSNGIPTNKMFDDHGHQVHKWAMQKPPALITGSTTSSVATVLLQRHESLLLLFTGSAIPRANRIRIFTLEAIQKVEPETMATTTICQPLWDVTYQGHLLGHQDWITCMDWTTMKPNNSNLSSSSSSSSVPHKSYLLASGSQDAKIRLWKFLHTITNLHDNNTSIYTNDNIEQFSEVEEEDDKDDDFSSLEAQETLVVIEDEEARLILQHSPSSNGKTAVTLEAILVGHEDIVTSVSWQPNNTNNILLSSSMDRSILLWSLEEEEEKEVNNTDYSKDSNNNNNNINKPITSSCWIPHARIGVAGGILGASIGSSLLGFVNAVWVGNTTIVGHGYGGTLYFWSCNTIIEQQEQQHKQQQWKAQPPLTGHFRPVNDLSWEPTNGEFLLTVSSDQTCRLIAPIPKASLSSSTITGTGGDCSWDSTTRSLFYWREVGRPQVHGYDIHTVSCIGGVGDEPYGRFISGSSEKQLRAFDAPCATLRLLDRISNPWPPHVYHETELLTSRLQGRPEKSFLPSLGLTNKAVEHEGDTTNEVSDTKFNEEDFDSSIYHGKKTSSDPDSSSSSIEDLLPRERELGTSTLWPEVTQLFGHPTDVICVASTSRCKFTDDDESMVIVASSCKARNSEQASIRLWNVSRGSCLGTLKVTKLNDKRCIFFGLFFFFFADRFVTINVFYLHHMEFFISIHPFCCAIFY
jgi:WD40 repeat protein